jgi:hypothetical protein
MYRLVNSSAEHTVNKKLKVQHIAQNKNMLYFCRPQKWGFYFENHKLLKP